MVAHPDIHPFWGNFRVGGYSPRTAGYLELDANCRILFCRGAAYRLGLCCKGVRASRRRYQEPMVMQSRASSAPVTAKGTTAPERSEAKSAWRESFRDRYKMTAAKLRLATASMGKTADHGRQPMP